MTETAGLAAFSEPTRTWFGAAFAAPTEAQIGAWRAIRDARHTLVVAPTGSGKTLSAFLASIDRLLTTATAGGPQGAHPGPLRLTAQGTGRRCRAQPPRAAERASGRPRSGWRRSARARGHRRRPVRRHPSGRPPPTRHPAAGHPDHHAGVAVPDADRAARETLRNVDTVIIDEVHAVAGTKRGAHLALSLERLDAAARTPRAADRPVRHGAPAGRGGALPRRPRARSPSWRRRREGVGPVEVVVPVEDMSEPRRRVDRRPRRARRGRRPPRAVDLAARRGADGRSDPAAPLDDRVRQLAPAGRAATARLNELAGRAAGEPSGARAAGRDHGPVRGSAAARRRRSLAQAHHGSVSKEQRAQIEADLKTGRLPCVVATSPRARHRHGCGRPGGPGGVAAVGGQRAAAGRPGRPPGRRRLAGVFFPNHRGDLIESAVVGRADAQRRRSRRSRMLRNPLDVLAQQIVADRRDARSGRSTSCTTLVRRARAVRRRCPRRVRGGARHARRALSVARSSPSSGRGSSGTGTTGRLTGRPGRAATGGDLAAAPSPTAGCSGSSWSGPRTARAPGRRARRGDGLRDAGSATCSPSARPAGGSRRSPTTGCWSRRPGLPGRLPFWKGDTPGPARPSSGAAFGGFTRELAALAGRPGPRAR